MLTQVIFLAIGALFGLGATVAGVAAPMHFPTMPPWVWYWLFWGGIALMALMLIDAGLLLIWANDQGSKLTQASIINVGFILIAGAIIWHYATADDINVTGFASLAVVRLYDTPEKRPRYIYDFFTDRGAEVKFFLSASGNFTFEVRDINKSSYSLEVPVGEKGIPIDRAIVLFCELGILQNTSFLRMTVDYKQVGYRLLPFAINLGGEFKLDRDKPGVIGADAQRQNFGTFTIGGLAFYRATLTRAEKAQAIAVSVGRVQ